jgi:phosphate-selective porin OprO/OprP
MTRERSVISRGFWATASLAGTIAASPITTAHAQSAEEMLALIREQKAQITAMQARVSELERKLTESLVSKSAPVQPTTAPAPAPPPPAAAETTIAWKGVPDITSKDGLSMKPRGRLLTDYWIVPDRNGVDYPSGALMRSVRIGLEGKLMPELSYEAEVDFSGDRVSVKGFFFQLQGKNDWNVAVGNVKPPFSLETIMGLHRVTFLERALPAAFGYEEQLGANYTTSGKNWHFSAGVFGEEIAVTANDKGYGTAARFVYAPILTKDQVLHFGVSGVAKHLTTESGVGFRIRQRPESPVFETRLLDTGANDADGYKAGGLEVLYNQGGFSTQAEYISERVNYRTLANSTFSGGYVQASWFVTGESRPYDIKRAVLGRLRPNKSVGSGGMGAFEIAARYSTLDLEGGAIRGGREDNFTLGVNWYLSPYTRFAANWVHFDVENSTRALPLRAANHSGNAFGVRLQADW